MRFHQIASNMLSEEQPELPTDQKQRRKLAHAKLKAVRKTLPADNAEALGALALGHVAIQEAAAAMGYSKDQFLTAVDQVLISGAPDREPDFSHALSAKAHSRPYLMTAMLDSQVVTFEIPLGGHSREWLNYARERAADLMCGDKKRAPEVAVQHISEMEEHA